MGINASILKACDELSERTLESRFASVMRRGWAEQSPVMDVSPVLSDDRTVPSRVAPCGSLALRVISQGWPKHAESTESETAGIPASPMPHHLLSSHYIAVSRLGHILLLERIGCAPRKGGS